MPEELAQESAWVGSEGEVYHLLCALKAVIGEGASSLTFDQIGNLISEINFGNLLSSENRPTIVSSLLLVEMLKEKVSRLFFSVWTKLLYLQPPLRHLLQLH